MSVQVFKAEEANAKKFDGGPAKGVTGRILIGQERGAENFCMRLFELAEGGHTPQHDHDWEHQIFFHDGEGEVLAGDTWVKVEKGSVAFIPGGERHQIRNTGKAPLVFVCLVPKGAPEL